MSPNEKVVACGMNQPEVVLFNNLTQCHLAKLVHTTQIQINQDARQQPTIYKEE